MRKITLVGAGGYVFPLVLIRDILGFPALQDSELALYDIDLGRANTTLQATNALIASHGLAAVASATDDPAGAFDGADYVICCFMVGGIDAYRADMLIPREYGIDQVVGDTLGPGGVFRALRTVGALEDIAGYMHRHCPDALLLQYANPMSINCWATSTLGIKTVGLCHSVQHTSRMLATEIDVPYDEVVYDSAGVNHTAWFTTFRRGDEDLIPRVRETMLERHLQARTDGELIPSEVYMGGQERVRTELMQLTGYFHTESSHHASEYWAWFRKNPETVQEYLPQRWDYYEICSNHSTTERAEHILEETQTHGLKPSEEFGAFIIDSIETGTQRVIYGNVPNNGLITNLAADACVEVACAVDHLGVRPIHYGELPAACAALNTVQINTQRLAVHAALQRDRSLVHAAIALDPLTSAKLTLPQTREMVDRMFDAQQTWLPTFNNDG